MQLVILQFDGLCASDLSCYGGTQVTPGFDTLASRADVYDQCFFDDVSPLPQSDHIVTAPGKSSFQVLFDSVPEVNNLPLRVQIVCKSHFKSSSHFEEKDSISSDSMDNRPSLEPGSRENMEVSTSDSDLSASVAEYDAAILVALALRPLTWGLLVTGMPRSENNAQIPLFVSLPEQSVSRRRRQLLTSADISALVETLTCKIEDYPEWRDRRGRSQIEYRIGTKSFVRDSRWLLVREQRPDSDVQPRLYCQPDDMWQVLDVADQHLELIAHFDATGELTFPNMAPSNTI